MVTKRGGLWRPRCYIRITTSNIESTSCILLKCLIDLYMYQRPSMLCCSIMGYYTYSRLLATLAHSLQCHGVVVLWGEMHWLQDWRSEAYPIFNWCIKKDTKLDTMIFHDFPLFVRAIFPRLPGLCKRLPTLLWEASGQNIAYAFICVLVCVFAGAWSCVSMCRISLRVHVVGFACLHHLLSILRYPRSCHCPSKVAPILDPMSTAENCLGCQKDCEGFERKSCMPCPYSWQFKLKGQVNVSCYIFTFYELSCFEWFAGLLTATHHAQSHRSKHHRRGYSKGLQARKTSVGENTSKPIVEHNYAILHAFLEGDVKQMVVFTIG